LALALRVLPEAHRAVDLRDDRVVLGTPRLEELRHARETARDVLRLHGLARDLRDHVAGLDPVAFRDEEVRAHREEVASLRLRAGELDRLPLLVLHGEA